MVPDVVFGVIAEENPALLICPSAPGTGPPPPRARPAQPGQGNNARGINDPGQLTAPVPRVRPWAPAASRVPGVGHAALSRKGLKKFGLFHSANTISGMQFESLFKRHVIATDSLYYHNSSKLIGFRFMEKYANAQRTTHIPHCGYKSSSQRIRLIEFDY